MLKEIKKFYDKVKLNKYVEDKETEESLFVHNKIFYKSYPRFPSVDLSKVDKEESEFENLLNYRKSFRNFSDKPLSFENLSKILGSCRIVDSSEEFERRTYPSGGARFPVEIYYLSYNTRELKNGAYHYNLKQNSLEQLLKKNFSSKEQRELISPYLENPAGTIILTSAISRSEVKYGLRAYPYSLIEAGHIGQNILLASSEIAIGACPVSGFVDKKVKEILDLIENEIPIYSISLGNIRKDNLK